MSVCSECGTEKFEGKEHEEYFKCGCWLLEDGTPMPQAACRVIKELRAKWDKVLERLNISVDLDGDDAWVVHLDTPNPPPVYAKQINEAFENAVKAAMKVKP